MVFLQNLHFNAGSFFAAAFFGVDFLVSGSFLVSLESFLVVFGVDFFLLAVVLFSSTLVEISFSAFFPALVLAFLVSPLFLVDLPLDFAIDPILAYHTNDFNFRSTSGTQVLLHSSATISPLLSLICLSITISTNFSQSLSFM